jgi:zinc/manganese transport system substrate-binding protein
MVHFCFKNHYYKILALMAALFFAAPIAVQAQSAKTAPKIVVTHPILHDWVNQIAKGHVTVTNLLPYQQDPHHFEPSWAMVSDLQNADLVLAWGLGWEPWLQRTPLGHVIYVADALNGPLLPQGRDINPHVWLDPDKACQMISFIATALSEKDPERAAFYQEQQRLYTDRIRQVTADIAEAFGVIAPRKVITLHPSFDYFMHAFQVRLLGYLYAGGHSHDVDPAAYDVARVVQLLKSHPDALLLTEPEGDGPSIARNLQREADAGTVVVAPSETLMPPGIDPDNYLDLLQYLARKMLHGWQAVGQPCTSVR